MTKRKLKRLQAMLSTVGLSDFPMRLCWPVACPSDSLRVFLKANPATAPDGVRAEWRTAHSLIYPPAARGKALGRFDMGQMKRMRKFLMRLQTFRAVPSTFDIYSNRLLPSLRPKPKSL